MKPPWAVKIKSAAVLTVALLCCACARPRPAMLVATAPPDFATPERAFAFWVRASQDGDEERLRRCYFPGLGEDELRAWLERNRDPRARTFFQGMQLLGVEPRSPVEVGFQYRGGDGSSGSGILVRTSGGWKLLAW